MLEIALGSDPHHTHSLLTLTVRIRQGGAPEALALVWPGVAELHHRSLISSNLTDGAWFTDWQPGSNVWNEIPIRLPACPHTNPCIFN